MKSEGWNGLLIALLGRGGVWMCTTTAGERRLIFVFLVHASEALTGAVLMLK
jgi:hypothetical protein